jgi:hypothetical protein
MTPKIGPSTIAMLTGAVVVMVAFIDTWGQPKPLACRNLGGPHCHAGGASQLAGRCKRKGR